MFQILACFQTNRRPDLLTLRLELAQEKGISGKGSHKFTVIWVYGMFEHLQLLKSLDSTYQLHSC